MAKGKKRIDASTFNEVVDATETIEVIVRIEHCRQAVPADPERCALVLAAKSQHPFDYFVVHRTIAYSRARGTVQMVRYQSSEGTRLFVEAFDAGDFTQVPPEGVSFKFNPPRKALSLAHLRSDHRKKIRADSRERVKGKERRPYRLPDPKTLAGVRNRFGLHS
jgi:hypothetical protein